MHKLNDMNLEFNPSIHNFFFGYLINSISNIKVIYLICNFNLLFSLTTLFLKMEKMKLVIFLFAENLTITLLLILRNIYTKYLCFFNELITFLLFNIVELNMIVYSCSDTLYICLFFEIMLRIYLLKKIKKFNVFSTFLKGLIIYFYLACLENYSLIYSYIPNKFKILTYIFLKLLCIILLPKIIANDFTLMDEVNSGIIIYDHDLNIIFYNKKFNDLIEDLTKNEEILIHPNNFLEKIFSRVKKDDIDLNIKEIIKDYILLVNFKNINEDIKLKLDFVKLCKFLKEHKEDFNEYKLLFKIHFDEVEIRFNTYYLNLKIEDENIYFLINEKTNLSAIKEENNQMVKCLAKIAHDFKTPLKAIDKYCQELKDNKNSSISKSNESFYNSSSNSSSFENSNFIQAMGNYVLSLVDNLYIITSGILLVILENFVDKKLNEPVKPFRLIKACKFCIKIFKYLKKDDKNKSFSIDLEYDKKNLPDSIRINEKMFKQILINLLSNAFKFTIEGFIKLKVKLIESKVFIEVSDSGSGIRKEEQNFLFKPFYMAPSNQNINQDGSGIGLYIVREFLRKIGSDLNFSSEYKKGSRFFFEINIESEHDSNISHETILMNTYYPIIRQSQKELNNGRGTLSEIFIDDPDSSRRFDYAKGTNEISILSYRNNRFISSSKSIIASIENLSMIEDNNFQGTVNHFDKIPSLNFLSIPMKNISNNKLSLKMLNDVRSPFQINSKRHSLDEIKETNEFPILTIMVCDDSTSVRDSLKNMLENIKKDKFNLNYYEAINGLDCLVQLYIQKTKFDLLLIDENMPFLKGSAVVNLLREIRKDKFQTEMKIVSISGDNNEDFIKYLKKQGFDHVLSKDIKKRDLEDQIQILLSK